MSGARAAFGWLAVLGLSGSALGQGFGVSGVSVSQVSGVGIGLGSCSPSFCGPLGCGPGFKGGFAGPWCGPGFGGCSPVWGGGFGYKNWCSPCFNPCFSTVVGYAGLYPPLYVGGGYGGGGYDSALLLLAQQNAQLQNEVAQIRNNPQAPADDPGKRINVPLRNPPAGAAEARADRAKQATIAGSRNFAGGSYRRAAERFREAAKIDASDASPQFLLAQALFATRQYPAAAQALKRGLKANPDWIELEFDVRSLYGDENELLSQLADLARELKANPLDRDAMFLLGYQLFATGQQEKARTILEHAARMETDDRHLKPFFDYYAKKDDRAALEPAFLEAAEPAPPTPRPDARAPAALDVDEPAR